MIKGIYVHIPFCKKKCYYCDFLSTTNYSENDLDKYVNYIIKEINLYEKYEYNTVYFGGGTPSILNHDMIKKILENINYSEDSEITLEVNPNTVSYDNLVKYKEIGVNRISIGCQTFNDNLLKKIGRNHSSSDAIEIFNNARKAGFTNISIDIIFGLPNQTIENIREDLKIIKNLSPEHISIYSLIWKEGTKFWEMLENHQIEEIDENIEADMYELIIEELKKINYEHYEISTFSKLGYQSKHNLKYWRNEKYLGIGIGASGYIENIRYKNYEDFKNYYNFIDRKKRPINELETIDNIKNNEYYYIMGLRLLIEGVKISKEYKKIAEKLIVSGFLKKDKYENYILTKKGIFLANEVFVEFLK
ncbi:MAG: radical SAM family heme chaperone HemW [Fusobacteria bacterium]|nr:radical SAM family heme chaperone HemW [Fusobacteriota bacterium]